MSDASRTPASSLDVHFTTLGMFIIDEIHHGPSSARTVVHNILGGAGTYAILGARLFSAFPLSETLHWIVDAGSDFPVSCRQQLDGFRTGLHFREDHTRLTTRGYNSYPADDSASADDHREFRYLTPKKRLAVEDLQEIGLEHPRCIHLICSPQRCMEEVRKLGDSAGIIVVWEPVPDLCTQENRAAMLQAARMVDVVSPNHEELKGFFSDEHGGKESDARLEKLARQVAVGRDGEGCVVVRAGRLGCYIRQGSQTRGHWLPPFYEGSGGKSNPKVVDPTGGGNTFIGGLGIGLARGHNMVRSAAMGSVAASFAIEQIGLPVLNADARGETWNGVRVEERMAVYEDGLKARGIEF